MNLADLKFIFNRALLLTFEKKKLILMFFSLLLCGILVVFFRAIALQANQWISLSMTFLPIFLCAGLMLSIGILLIRIYHDEIKHKTANYREIVANSWELLIGASYLSIPIILTYLLLWMILGIFMLFSAIPGIGDFFGAILAFGPFLLNLAALILCILNFSILFFVAPAVAFSGLNRTTLYDGLRVRFQKDMFTNLLLAVVALLPLTFFGVLLSIAAFLTGTLCLTCGSSIQTVLQWFFIMIPFTALLSPAMVFFFNFAAESHVMLKKAVH